MVSAAKHQEWHWTEKSSEAFAHRLGFDFIAQIEKRMEALSISQIQLAGKLKISEGAVSKLLNNPQNLTLRTIAKYSRALGIKAAIVAYDDGDSQNKAGPIDAEVFTTCWERAGKPHDVWALNATQSRQTATTDVVFFHGIHGGLGLTGANWASNNSWTNPRPVRHVFREVLMVHGNETLLPFCSPTFDTTGERSNA